MKIEILNKFKTSQWSGGTTTELYIYPAHANYEDRNFIFRLSSATVENEKSVFTKLNGYHRYIAPLEGKLNISHDGENYYPIAINELYEFEGGSKTVSTGKCRDFNFMIRSSYKGLAKYVEIESKRDLHLKFEKTELIWFFSFDSHSTLFITINEEETIEILLKPMMLVILAPEKSDTYSNSILLSSSEKINLFYGRASTL